jgi:uncharacterized protein YodC (DUF2158 family)
MQFQVGDVVYLKSGGPAMTVETVKEGNVWTKWFDDVKGEPKGTFFKPEMLKKEDPREIPSGFTREFVGDSSVGY